MEELKKEELEKAAEMKEEELENVSGGAWFYCPDCGGQVRGFYAGEMLTCTCGCKFQVWPK